MTTEVGLNKRKRAPSACVATAADQRTQRGRWAGEAAAGAGARWGAASGAHKEPSRRVERKRPARARCCNLFCWCGPRRRRCRGRRRGARSSLRRATFSAARRMSFGRSGAALCQVECPPECLTCAADGACEACAFRQCLRLVSSGEQFSVQGVRKAEGGTCARGRAEVLDMLMADAAAGACLPLDGGRTGEVSASARAGVHVASASALAMLAAAVGSVVTRRGC